MNNAGVEVTAAYSELTREEIERFASVNLTSPMLLIRSALPGMLTRGRGQILNVASLAGKGPTPYQAPYAATKAGLIGLTRSLRAEYRGAPVGFSVVCPGFVKGEGMYARQQAEGWQAPFAFGASEMTKVVTETVKAIREDRPEVLINSRPLRPMLAFGELFPRASERAVDLGGAGKFFGAVARARGRAGAS